MIYKYEIESHSSKALTKIYKIKCYRKSYSNIHIDGHGYRKLNWFHNIKCEGRSHSCSKEYIYYHLESVSKPILLFCRSSMCFLTLSINFVGNVSANTKFRTQVMLASDYFLVLNFLLLLQYKFLARLVQCSQRWRTSDWFDGIIHIKLRGNDLQKC